MGSRKSFFLLLRKKKWNVKQITLLPALLSNWDVQEHFKSCFWQWDLSRTNPCHLCALHDQQWAEGAEEPCTSTSSCASREVQGVKPESVIHRSFSLVLTWAGWKHLAAYPAPCPSPPSLLLSSSEALRHFVVNNKSDWGLSLSAGCKRCLQTQPQRWCSTAHGPGFALLVPQAAWMGLIMMLALRWQITEE